MSQEQGQMLNFISRSNFNETQSDSSLKQVQTHSQSITGVVLKYRKAPCGTGSVAARVGSRGAALSG